MSQLSDIYIDVDGFIEENHMTQEMKLLMTEEDLNGEEYELKATPEDLSAELNKYLHQMVKPLNYPPPEQNLCDDDYPGPLNFEVFIIPSNEQKTPWEYSVKLNKIFIGMGLKFPVAFSLNSRPSDINLFVRVTPAYSQVQYFQELVNRCIGHAHAGDPLNKGFSEHVHQHIVRCNNDKACYNGDVTSGTRLNIVMPLGQLEAGTDHVREYFHFVCKNSCPQGMNRRPIKVIFTLEDETGQVLGRRSVCVRICSCPKRDREKEEKEFDKNLNPAPRGKKRKLSEGGDSRVPDSRKTDTTMQLLNVKIPGRDLARKVLESVKHVVADEIVKAEGKNDAPFRKCYNDLAEMITKMP